MANQNHWLLPQWWKSPAWTKILLHITQLTSPASFSLLLLKNYWKGWYCRVYDGSHFVFMNKLEDGMVWNQFWYLLCLTGKSKKSSVSGLKLENDSTEVNFSVIIISLWLPVWHSLLAEIGSHVQLYGHILLKFRFHKNASVLLLSSVVSSLNKPECPSSCLLSWKENYLFGSQVLIPINILNFKCLSLRMEIIEIFLSVFTLEFLALHVLCTNWPPECTMQETTCYSLWMRFNLHVLTCRGVMINWILD